MTREEAIKLLVNATYSDEWQGNEELQTALNMAIEALSRERVLDEVEKTIDLERKWLGVVGHKAYNVDIAFNSIKHTLRDGGLKHD